MLAVSPALELAMVLPHGVKGSAYLSASLRQEEEKTYMAAGVMAYRRSPGGIEVLLGRQSLRQGKSRAGTWSFIGGKRDPGENSSAGTAAREACEESMGHVTKDWLAAARLNNPAVLWQPVGSYAVYLAEVERPGTASVSASGVSDLVARLPTGEPLTLTRPHVEESDDATASLAHAHRILDDHGGGPLLLSRFCNTLYERLPSSRDVVKQAGGAQAWCEAHNLHTASGPEETRGQEKVWLARADALEVDALLWLPWVLLQSRRNYQDPIPLPNRLDVRIHPYFARWVLRSRGVERSVAGNLVRQHFDRMDRARHEISDLTSAPGAPFNALASFMKSPKNVRDTGRAL